MCTPSELLAILPILSNLVSITLKNASYKCVTSGKIATVPRLFSVIPEDHVFNFPIQILIE